MILQLWEVSPPEFPRTQVTIVTFESKLQMDLLDVLRENGGTRAQSYLQKLKLIREIADKRDWPPTLCTN